MNKKVIVKRIESVLQEYEYEIIVPKEATKEEILEKIDDGEFDDCYTTECIEILDNNHPLYFVDNEHAEIKEDTEWNDETDSLEPNENEKVVEEPDVEDVRKIHLEKSDDIEDIDDREFDEL